MQFHKLKPNESREQDGEPVHLTPAGIEKLRKRLERLQHSISDLAAEAARTAAYGDRSDNAEYKQAKGALRRTHAEIFEIEQKLKRAVAIEAGPDSSGKVKLGSTVVLETASANDKVIRRTYEIVGPTETDPPNGRISFQSPLGIAIIGHGIDEVVEIQTAHGTQKYKILEVR
jgi:transcription elongation factor GreA